MDKLLLIGAEDRVAEWMASPLGKLKPEIAGESLEGYSDDALLEFRTAFHLSADNDPKDLPLLLALPSLNLFVSSAKTTLGTLVLECQQEPQGAFYGLNALPTMLTRPLWEISTWQEAEGQRAINWLAKQGQAAELVADRVGMVTPRVLAMIINEAHWLLQEGGAEVADIDSAMRLGVNYPNGPFEWLDKLGTSHVVEVLQALADAYGSDTYKISDLLFDRLAREVASDEE
jgi:3-hydroxybutyryl-CoA dehydrogenase